MDHLIVIAHSKEADFFVESNVPVLITGFGKVDAAMILTKHLTENRVPKILVYGTAGRVNPAINPKQVYEVTEAVEYDGLLAKKYTIETPATSLPQVKIGTGSGFLTDVTAHDGLLHQNISMVDMETSVYIHVAQFFNIPIHIFKTVTDDASDGSDELWDEAVYEASGRLFTSYKNCFLK